MCDVHPRLLHLSVLLDVADVPARAYVVFTKQEEQDFQNGADKGVYNYCVVLLLVSDFDLVPEQCGSKHRGRATKEGDGHLSSTQEVRPH